MRDRVPSVEVAQHKEDSWRALPIDYFKALSGDLQLVPTGSPLASPAPSGREVFCDPVQQAATGPLSYLFQHSARPGLAWPAQLGSR